MTAKNKSQFQTKQEIVADTTYKVSHSKPPTKPYGESVKKGLFSNFSFFSTFARRTKIKTFFFVKNWTKKCTKNCFFHFLELKSQLVKRSDFTRKTEQKKNKKTGNFYRIYQIL